MAEPEWKIRFPLRLIPGKVRQMRSRNILLTATLCAAAVSAAHADFITGLNFLGQASFAARTVTVGGTTVGGLSGIRYDAANNRYLANSDDRGNESPEGSRPRFYSLNLNITGGAFGNSDVTFNSVTTLRDSAGQPFANFATDLESIQLAPDGQSVYISSEGDSGGLPGHNLVNPSVYQFDVATGQQIRQLTAPGYYNANLPAGPATGIRNNLAFESATLTNNGATLLTGTENAMKQDGPTSATGAFSPSRLLTFDVATGLPGAEYEYLVDPVVEPPTGTNFAVGGLVEMLSLGDDNYLGLERSFTVGGTATGTGYDIKLYQFSLRGATDISGIPSLSALPSSSVAPVRKTLLLDLKDLGIPLDNVEGVTFGPTLPGGQRSLILVSDDNFSLAINGAGSGPQHTQFLVFGATIAAPEPATLPLLAVCAIPFAILTLRRRKA